VIRGKGVGCNSYRVHKMYEVVHRRLHSRLKGGLCKARKSFLCRYHIGQLSDSEGRTCANIW